MVMKKFILYAPCLMAAFFWLPASEGQAFCAPYEFVTPQAAVEVAHSARAILQKYEYDIRAADETKRATISGYLPQIVVSAGAGGSNKTYYLPPFHATVGITQLVLSAAGPLTLYDIAEQDVFITFQNQQTERDRVQFEAETSSLNEWLARKKDAFVRALSLAAGDAIKWRKHEYEVGLSSLNEWLIFCAQYEHAREEVLKYTDQVWRAHAILERSLGLQGAPLARFDDSGMLSYVHAMEKEASALVDLGVYLDNAFTHRKELRANEELMKKERYLQGYYGRSYLPTLSLYFDMYHLNYGKFDSNTIFFSRGTGWRAGVRFDWQFDGLANVFNQGASAERESSALLKQVDLIEQIRRDVHTSYYDTQIACKDLRRQEAYHTQQENEIILKRKQFEVGEISSVDLMIAEKNWQEADYALLESRTAVARNYRTLMYQCGYPENISKVDTVCK